MCSDGTNAFFAILSLPSHDQRRSFFPHIFVCLFLLCASGRRPPPSVATLSHTTHPHAHNSLKHTTYPQTTHSHTQLPHPQLPHRPHTKRIFEVIHQELSPFICKLDGEHSNLSSIIRIMEGTPKWPSWPETPSNKFQNTKNSPYRVLGLALRHDCKNTMQITLKRKSMNISGCDNRVKKPMVLVGVLGLAPRRTKIYCRYTESIRLCFQHKCIASLGAVSTVLCTPLQEGEMKEKGEVLHLYRCYTNTHPAGAGSTLKGKRKKKADTTTGRRPKQRRGEGNKRTSRTNLHGETDLTSTGHTHTHT